VTESAIHPTARPETDLRAGTAADLTATEFLAALGRREISVLDYVRACADRIAAREPDLAAWVWYDRARFEEQAAQLDRLLAAAGAAAPLPGSLFGVPVGVKDIFNTHDMPTQMGSPIYAGYKPGNDARVVSNLRRAHAIMAGKTVTAEFAVHHPGPTRNPYDLTRTPGTSSSGSAVAVATSMVPVALASQTAGSIIRPASYCGVFGFKPSFGLVARTGVLKTTDTLDTIGWMARSVDDLALVLETARVRGHNYPVSEAGLADRIAHAPKAHASEETSWRVGLVEAPVDHHQDPAVRDGLQALARRLESAGATVVPFPLPAPLTRAHDVHQVIYDCVLAYYFKPEWAAKREVFSDRLGEMIERGLSIPLERYQAALAEQVALARAFDAAVQSVDVLLTASTAGEAPVGLDAIDPPDTCLIWTLCGAPSLSLPLLAGSTDLPVGVQAVARRFGDYPLLDFARFLHRRESGR
jgi:Asp-tRNA(Asn)/Glu-tRNA(Gln) amidotransferase A subunit family amidase